MSETTSLTSLVFISSTGGAMPAPRRARWSASTIIGNGRDRGWHIGAARSAFMDPIMRSVWRRLCGTR